MKIDNKKKELKISIREFAALSINHGPIRRKSSTIPNRLKASIGTEIHKSYQENAKIRNKTVKSEFYVKYKFNFEDWTIIIRGRADIVYEKDGYTIIEEIKSVSDVKSLKSYEIKQIAHSLQLQLYSHYFQNLGNEVKCYLVLYNLISDDYLKIEVKTENMTEFINSTYEAIIRQIEAINKEKDVLSQRSRKVKFPFKNYRPHQENILKHVVNSLEKQDRLLLLAPSGLGKTVGTLYPSLKYSLKENLRLFITTSKTTQQKIYQDTLKLMQKNGADFKAVILTAKRKICNNVEFICDTNLCPYLANYSEKKVKSAVDLLLVENVISSRPIKKVANNLSICAFELSLDLALECDVILGDYNYIFHPHIRLRRFFNVPHKDSILIIDEVHNLPDRANDYYSPSLCISELLEVDNFLIKSKITKKLLNRIKSLLQSMVQYIRGFVEVIGNYEDKGIVEIEDEKIIHFQNRWDNLVIEYIRELGKYGNVPDASDLLIIFGEKLKFFNIILKESHSAEFSHIYGEGELKIFCKSAAYKLAEQMKGFHSVIAQSATLYPPDYYRKIIGFPDNANIITYNSPFPKKNRLHLVYPSVSTKYKARDSFYDNIAALIVQGISSAFGNYLAFFPSFNFLNNVKKELENFQFPLKLLIQEKEMSEYKRKRFLKKLNQDDEKYLLLGVHGGIFSEGVDYQGEMAIGAFIIGPGLPAYTFEQNLMKEYFDDKWQKGFEYAYRNIGLNRVIQAAGRIFRSPSDKGMVMLVGCRFNTPFYSKELPVDWDLVVTSNPIHNLNEFWGITG